MTDARRDDPHLDDAYRAADAAVREGDRDRWLAALFMPEAARRHVLALEAFSLEIARIRDLVSDPLPGEVRMQWWRDVVEGTRGGEGASHPVAAALLDTIRRFDLPVGALTALIEARIFDLYDDPMPSLNDLEGYAGETASALFQLSAIVLAGGRDPGTADLSGHAGVAYALTGLLRAVPFHAARGQVYVPLALLEAHGASRDDLIEGRPTPALREALADLRRVARHHLARARSLAETAAPETRAAFLPLALVEPYLDRMERKSYDPFRTPVEISPWWKQIILWRAARRGG